VAGASPGVVRAKVGLSDTAAVLEFSPQFVGVPRLDSFYLKPPDDLSDGLGGVDDDVTDVAGKPRSSKLHQLLAAQYRFSETRVNGQEGYFSWR
jgi:hypothetical protein